MSEAGVRNVTPQQAKRVWGTGSRYRLFLSHRAEDRKETSKVKAKLEKFGISAFVAHNDIHPTQQWQNEIENALATMDGFAALMSTDFFNSEWTNQEIGYALARGVPIVPVNLGTIPSGFIGRIQAAACRWEDVSISIAKLLIGEPKALDAFIAELPECSGFDMGNELACVLPEIEEITSKQAEKLRLAYNDNYELLGSYGFNGKRPSEYGRGLAHHLKRLTGATYGQNRDNTLKRGIKWV